MAANKPFESYDCRSMSVHFEISRDKFESDSFLAAMMHPSGSAYCYTEHPDISDYHVHLDWNMGGDDDNIEIDVTFHIPGVALEKGEKEPYAENAVRWLGRFFKNETAQATMRGRFKYDAAERQSKFPLPMRLGNNISQDFEAVIEGLSFDLPSKPYGVDGVFIMAGKTRLNIRSQGETRIRFEDFNLSDLIKDVSELILKFTALKSSVTEVKS